MGGVSRRCAAVHPALVTGLLWVIAQPEAASTCSPAPAEAGTNLLVLLCLLPPPPPLQGFPLSTRPHHGVESFPQNQVPVVKAPHSCSQEAMRDREGSDIRDQSEEMQRVTTQQADLPHRCTGRNCHVRQLFSVTTGLQPSANSMLLCVHSCCSDM